MAEAEDIVQAVELSQSKYCSTYATLRVRGKVLDISRDDALARVAARAATHFYPASLVDSQFATLESPVGEVGVLRVDAGEPVVRLQRQVSDWLHKEVYA